MESHYTVMIRTDANSEIASGHMMRCLTIAEELCHHNASVIFALSDEKSLSCLKHIQLLSDIRPDSFRCVVLGSDYRNVDDETSLLQEQIHLFSVDLILFDSYFVTEAYLSYFSSLCKTAYIDDISKFDYPVNFVINYDLFPDVSFYRTADTRLMGPKYAPLRSQFKNISYSFHKEVQNILISTGGTDPYEIEYQLLDAIFHGQKDRTLSFLNYHVIVPSNEGMKKKLMGLSAQFSNIILHEQVKDMAALMKSCDLAITASGTTLYELCAVSVPTLCFSMADNQMEPAGDFNRAGCCVYVGDCRDCTSKIQTKKEPSFVSSFIDELLCKLSATCSDVALRISMHEKMNSLIDGMGASRIVQALLQK